MNIPKEIIERVNTPLLQHLSHYVSVMHAQQKLLDDLGKQNIIPIVLMGTAVAQYYEHPEARTFGDIDILIYNENEFNADVCALQNLGYRAEKIMEN